MDHWWLDWQTLSPANVSETAFELGIKGIMYDDRAGESQWSTAFPDMPYDISGEAA